MGVLIGLLPFALLPALRAMLSARSAALVSLAVAVATLLRQAAAGNPKSLNVLVVTVLALATLLIFRRPDFARWNGVIIDGTLAIYAFAGLAIGVPFSAEFARDTVEPAYWNHPVFLHVTSTITLVWAIAFVLLAGLAWPAERLSRPRWLRPLASALLILVAASFTAWYPGYARAAFVAAQGGGFAAR